MADERLREALRWYANRNRYRVGEWPQEDGSDGSILPDQGERARVALSDSAEQQEPRLIEEFVVIHAPGWPAPYKVVPQTLEAGREFVEENGGTLRRRFISEWRDDEGAE